MFTMKVVVLLIILYAVESTQEMVCKIEKNQLTDSQKASWRSYLEPIAKSVQLINQAIAISSAKDFSIADKKGSFNHVKSSNSFQTTVRQVQDEMSTYVTLIAKPTVPVAMRQFNTNIKETLDLILDDESVQEELKGMIDTPKSAIERLLAKVEDALTAAVTQVDSVRNLLEELAAIKVTSDDDNILSECVKRFQMIVPLLRAANRFPSEMLFRVHHLRRQFNKTFQLVDKAIDAKAVGRVEIRRFLICSFFRVQQEIMFMTEMTNEHQSFCEKFGHDPETTIQKAQADYDGTLKAIEKKAVEAEERIKAIPQELTDAYNKQVDIKAKEVAKFF